MSMIEVGAICVKTYGREKGRRCVVVDTIDKNFVLVTGPPELTGVKRRRANIKHLEPTGEKIDVKKGSSDQEVTQILQRKGQPQPARKKSRQTKSKIEKGHADD
ncbi:50S ribosomal protein L14e [Candidatus Bathyarchaeota archaeon]|nr:50S ribosomal protein L14e [Candidatus Bathyarchaeota archaeon]MBS7629434.1 50S ribosomal protein L14e [Candidatus Bathyarchaeota archaeon]